jgi:soluble lytic murein transglycosylase-like protein
MLLAALASLCPPAHAAEHITLRSGAEFDCARHEPAGDRVRLYLFPSAQAASDNPNYIEVSASSILRVETVADPPPPPAANTGAPQLALSSPKGLDSEMRAHTNPTPAQLTPTEMHQMLSRAGAAHNIDSDLLASVVKAESNGNARAVSHAGARGLMQLMPSTASTLAVHDSFAPEENITGGTAYLDQLLTRYHDDIALAVAAYNAGPAAVDRYHGIPPFAETRAYVARVIREFNRLKRANPTLAAAIH